MSDNLPCMKLCVMIFPKQPYSPQQAGPTWTCCSTADHLSRTPCRRGTGATPLKHLTPVRRQQSKNGHIAEDEAHQLDTFASNPNGGLNIHGSSSVDIV